MGEIIELLFRIHEVVIIERDSELEELLFRIEGGAVGEVGTIEGVETTELLFKTYAVVGPAEVVGTIEDVETIELLFRTEGVDMAEEDTELWTN